MMSTTTKFFGFMLVITTFIMVLLAGSSSATFHVGDSLLFDGRNFDKVIQVSGVMEYELCDSSSPKAVHTAGSDVLTLTEPGLHYFISSDHSQCLKGQKLQVPVVPDTSRPIQSPIKIFKVLSNSNEWSLPEANDYLYKTGSDDLVKLNGQEFDYFKSSKTGSLEFKRRAVVREL